MAVPTGKAFVDALVRAGFVSADDLNDMTSIRIEVTAKTLHDLLTVEITHLGDEKLLAAVEEFEGETANV